MIELDLAKAHLRAEGTAEDELIQSYLDAAAAFVEAETQKLLDRREVTQDLRSLGAYVPLWWGPAPTGVVIDYLDSDAAAQTVELPRLVGARVYPPIAGWPSVLDASPIAATYEAGYDPDEVPADLVQAQLMLVAHWFQNRSAVNVGNIVNEAPLAVETILRRYRPVLI